MQTSETSSNFQQQVLTEFKLINQRLDKIEQELALTNTRVDTYQKASNQVVNLAFGLIATATVIIIASVILK